MKSRYLVIACLLIAAISFPPQYYPVSWRLQLAGLFGVPGESSPAQSKSQQPAGDIIRCPEDSRGWRKRQTIDGVDVGFSPGCEADNPYAVAAFVKGTNRVSESVLHRSGLTPDAVEKGRDLDGDGDPDEIHIRLEVAELNGFSPDSEEASAQYPIAPGIEPGLWVFAPKMFGMASENFESANARPMLRLPSPAIRVEQGDRVHITLENTHYMPHTIHFHGVDHKFINENGEGNDGVPIASEKPVMPGGDRTYLMQPRHAGTMFYHCHVQPQVHIMMGLQGLFVVEENRPDNWLQTLNIGAGQVRFPSVAVREDYSREYDLHYLDIDAELNQRIRHSNDPRVITRSMHRDYDITDSTVDYFVLNGRSFPYTFRESLVVTGANQHTKLRVANGGSNGIALHTHGHKVKVTHEDGVALPTAQQSLRDVIWIAGAQRVDIDLYSKDDGLHSYGEGIWLFHDHQQKATTSNGIAPGGHISAIVYENHLGEDGWPATRGIDWSPFFTSEYYQREIPVWARYATDGKFGEPQPGSWQQWRLVLFSLAMGLLLGLLVARLLRLVVRP